MVKYDGILCYLFYCVCVVTIFLFYFVVVVLLEPCALSQFEIDALARGKGELCSYADNAKTLCFIDAYCVVMCGAAAAAASSSAISRRSEQDVDVRQCVASSERSRRHVFSFLRCRLFDDVMNFSMNARTESKSSLRFASKVSACSFKRNKSAPKK